MLLNESCLTALKKLKADSVASIVTDPPYGLGFMGKQWDSLPPGRQVFEECLRVLKPGGHLCCFGGSRTYHRMAVAVEDAGFEIRDQIQWIYGSGFPKSQNIGKAVDKIQGNERQITGKKKAGITALGQGSGWNKHNNTTTPKETQGHSEWEGYGTALKPAHEPIVLARKPIEKGLSIAQNCLKWGVGAINVDGCRVGTENIRTTHHVGNSFSQDYKSKGDERQISHYSETQGRFPANLCHDGSDEVVGLFPVTSSGGGDKTNTRPTGKDYGDVYGNFYNKERSGVKVNPDSGSAARFFYTAKAKKKERLTFNNHPTVKPVTLMQYLVRLITPAGGTCLDPFAGSGTTGLACMKEGRSYILIDSDSGSIDIARGRLLSEIISQEYRRAARRRLNTHRSQLQIF